MSSLSWRWLMAACTVVALPSLVHSASPPPAAAEKLSDATRAVELGAASPATLRTRRLSRALQELDSQNLLTRATIESLRRQVDEFRRFHDSKAFFVSRTSDCSFWKRSSA